MPIIVLLCLILLFVGWKKPMLRPVRLVLSACVSIWGLVDLIFYRQDAMTLLGDWLHKVAPYVGDLNTIQIYTTRTLNHLIPICCWGPISVAAALLILAGVLRRMDMDISPVIYSITAVGCVLPLIFVTVYSIPSLVKMPEFFFVIWPLIVNVTALLTFPLALFATIIRTPPDGLGPRKKCAF